MWLFAVLAANRGKSSLWSLLESESEKQSNREQRLEATTTVVAKLLRHSTKMHFALSYKIHPR